MRIRKRPLPFPPLLTSPLPVSEPSPSNRPISPPKTDATREETTKANASVKIELVLHPNRGLPPIEPSGLGTNSTSKRDSQEFHSSPSTSFPPVQVWKKEEEEEEEKESVESTRNKGAQINTVKRRATNNPNEDKEKQEGEEKAKQEKKPRRSSGSAVLMEGSRCSRVNGRGWRCCQPTLVGYSLCEHHLGKGRMRSMNNAMQGQLGCTEHKKKSSDEGSGEKNGKKKRNRVPTVKARSISSLLDEGNVDHDDDDEDYELIGDYMRNESSE